MRADLITTPVEHDPFAGRPILAVAPITESQREIWLATQLDDDATLAYDEASEITLKGPLDVERLRRVWQRITERHEALRCTFSADGEWVVVHTALPLDIPLDDLATLDAGEREARLLQMRQEEVRRRFDLEQGPLFSVRVARVSADEHRVFFTAHHIVVDGWSAAEIYKDFARLYDRDAQGQATDDTPSPSFCAFARDEAAWRQTEEGRATLDWWAAQFADGVPTVELPTDRPRTQERSFAAGRVDHALDAELVAALRKLGAARGASLVATTLGAFAALLQRLSGAEDMVVGLAASAQSYLGRGGLVGHAVNLLPLRFKPQATQAFSSLLKEVRGTVLDAFEHQRFTFSTLLPRLKIVRDPGRPPLVPVVFNIDVRNDPICPQGIDVHYQTLSREYENFELFVNAVDDGSTLCFECAFNTALYDASTIASWMRRFERMLRALVTNADQPLGQLPATTQAERERVVVDFNRTQAEYTSCSIPELVAGAVAVASAKAAVVTAQRTLDYAELNRLSDALAAQLVTRGVGKGAFVALCMQRSALLPAALLGILKSGAAYLPLDPEFPKQRLHDIVSDSGARLLLADAETMPLFDGVESAPLLIDALWANESEANEAAAFMRPHIDSSDAAYVIYTSGTTGKPKGVVVTHRNVANFLASMRREPGLDANDALLAVTTISFDIAGLELWLPLTTGATVVLADREMAVDGEALRARLETPLDDGRHINWMQATPGSWRLLLSAGWSGNESMKAACGGEPLPRDLAESLLPKVGALWNLYGPTETTIWSTASQVIDAGDINIGKPIANTQCYVLDGFREPLPVGGVGELWIGGDGVSRGYHARPELTAERFVDHPEFGRLYRTGDLARWRDDGRLMCLGRTDFQVKLRGFRIELGDIEAALNDHPDVAEALSGVRERSPGDPRLVAYVAMKAEGGFNAGELRRHLRGLLPGYMIPQHYIALEALPRLPNGKLDRRALPDPFGQGEDRPLKSPLQTPAERYVAAIWSQVLGNSDIGRDDRFFDVGGHSLLAVQIVSRIGRETGQRLPMRSLMMESLRVIAGRLPQTSLPFAGPGSSVAVAAGESVAVDTSLGADTAAGPSAGAPEAKPRGLFARLFRSG